MADNILTPAPAGKTLAFQDIAGVLFALTILRDAAGTDAVGTVAGTPASGTILGRLKAIADAVAPLAGLEDGQEGLLATIGTRAYGAGQRIAIGLEDLATTGLTATEVLVSATSRCFIRAGAAATNITGLPVEANSPFHLRITSGAQIHVIRDTADGYLNVVPVV